MVVSKADCDNDDNVDENICRFGKCVVIFITITAIMMMRNNIIIIGHS